MAPPQLITDFMRLMLLLAPSAAVICLVLSGLSLRQGSVPDALIGGNFAKWMFWAIVFLTLPQLISWFPSFGVPASLPGGGIGTGWMATLQSDLANFVLVFPGTGFVRAASQRSVFLGQPKTAPNQPAFFLRRAKVWSGVQIQ